MTQSGSEVARGEVLDLTYVNVSYGVNPILVDLSLNLEMGEVVRLRGANGSGKTTLYRAIAGLNRFDSGSVRIMGSRIQQSRRELLPHVGLVSHDSYLYATLTVRENLELISKNLSADPSRMEGALDYFGIGKVLQESKVDQLSSGQSKRVQLAALLIKNPPLWLLDEPHSSLDLSGRDLLDRLISQAATSGTTIVFTSHEGDSFDIAFTRQLLLSRGSITEDSKLNNPEDGVADR
jgi:heme exporter protein A